MKALIITIVWCALVAGIINCIVQANLARAQSKQPQASKAKQPVKIVLIAGKQSHGSGEHQHKEGVLLLKKCLDTSPNVKGVKVETHFDDWPKNDTALDDAAAILIYSDGRGGHPLAKPQRAEKIRKLMKQGVGLVIIHYAVDPPANLRKDFIEWIGGHYKSGYSTNPVYKSLLTPATPKHPICRGLSPFKLRDECYYRIVFQKDDKRLTPIITTMPPPGKNPLETIAWAVERKDGGRGFAFTGGHFHKNWQIEDFRKLVLNAILWAAKVEVPAGGVQSKLPAKSS